jgi:amidase
MALESAVAQETTGVKARREVEDSTWLSRQAGHAVSAAELSIALERLHSAPRLIAPLFDPHDALLTPTPAQPPVRHGAPHPKGLEATLQALAACCDVASAGAGS